MGIVAVWSEKKDDANNDENLLHVNSIPVLLYWNREFRVLRMVDTLLLSFQGYVLLRTEKVTGYLLFISPSLLSATAPVRYRILSRLTHYLLEEVYKHTCGAAASRPVS